MAITQTATTVRTAVLPNTYRDSVELMRVAAEVEAIAGVTSAALVTGTSANKDVLLGAGLLEGEATAAGPNDLIIAVAGAADVLEAAESRARALLSGKPLATSQTAGARVPPRTLAEALGELPEANLVVISTPGAYATAEAMKALKRNMDVFLFSDNVSIHDELELKELARRKNRLLMGPDCGTAILEDIPLGFANAVRSGSIGLAGASGTGLQQVTCLIDRLGEGVSQAIGVGGRDLDERVGGMMMLAALERLASDERTRVVVLISKPPAPAVAERVLGVARRIGKPVVVNFLGDAATSGNDDGFVRVSTLEDAALSAVALVRGEQPVLHGPLHGDLMMAAADEARKLRPGQARIVGLYSGGTLCKEALHVLHQVLPNGEYTLLDLGDDEFTVGRPHPMIDARLRSERILEVGADATTGVLLLDVVIGYGSHADPAGALLAAIDGARRRAVDDGRYLSIVASVCGTSRDPQNLAEQEASLRRAGVLLAPSNAQAARLAALIAGSDR
jgi:FdrA protein